MGPMIGCSRLAMLVILLASVVTRGESRPLQFVKQIGSDWLSEKPGWMSFVSFSPDGTMVASDGAAAPGDVSGNLTLWTFPAGQLIRRLPVRASLSGDWKYYATFHEVAETESGRTLISLPEQQDATFAFSPDGHYLVESSARQGAHSTHIRLLELASGKRVSTFGQHNPSSMAISPDGQTLASGHWNIVMLRNMFTGKRVATLRGFGRYVTSVSFSPEGERLAAGTDAGGLQIWDLGRRTRIQGLALGGQYVSAPAFSPDGRLLAVGVYGTGIVWLIDATTGAVLDHEKVSDIGCGSAAFSPDGRFLITPSTGGLVRWPYDRGGTIRVFQIHRG
jgi:WD40 repeat protein